MLNATMEIGIDRFRRTGDPVRLTDDLKVEIAKQLELIRTARPEFRRAAIIRLGNIVQALNCPGKATVPGPGLLVNVVAFTSIEGIRYYASLSGLWLFGCRKEVLAADWLYQLVLAYRQAERLRTSRLVGVNKKNIAQSEKGVWA